MARKQEAADTQSAKVAAKIDKEDFQYKGTISEKEANELLKQVREWKSAAASATSTTNKAARPIKKYDDFEKEISSVYNRLNRDYNMDDLVPIYRIRQELGDRVSRSQFNNWMLDMQAKDKLLLMGGEVRDATPSRVADSIMPPVGNLRYFAKWL